VCLAVGAIIGGAVGALIGAVVGFLIDAIIVTFSGPEVLEEVKYYFSAFRSYVHCQFEKIWNFIKKEGWSWT